MARLLPKGAKVAGTCAKAAGACADVADARVGGAGARADGADTRADVAGACAKATGNSVGAAGGRAKATSTRAKATGTRADGAGTRVDGAGACADALGLLASFALWELNTHLIKPSVAVRGLGLFVHGQLNDLLGGFAFLCYTNLLFDFVRPSLRITRPVVALPYILACGLFWEYAAPLFVAGSTSDAWDLVAYLLGGVLYLLLQEPLTRVGTRAAGALEARREPETEQNEQRNC